MYRHLKIARTFAELLDNKFEIAGAKFGLDPIIGLIPVIGDILPLITSAYFVWIGWQMGIPKNKLGLMALNTFIDVLIGLTPVFGDIGDFAYKCHSQNMQILDEYLEKPSVLIEGKIVG